MGLYFQCTNKPFTPFSPQQSTLYWLDCCISHSSCFSLRSTWPWQWSSPSRISLVSLVTPISETEDFIGLFVGIPGKALPPLMFTAKQEYPISSLLLLHCIRQKNVINRHFRTVGVLLTLDHRWCTELHGTERVLTNLEHLLLLDFELPEVSFLLYLYKLFFR